MTSTFSATPYSASSRAWPGPTVARASTSQPAARIVVRIELTATGAVRAAAGLVMSKARGTLELSFPADIGADLVGVAGGHAEVGSARLYGGLNAGGQTPFAAEPELETRAQVAVGKRPEVFGAEAGVEGHESLLAQLPTGGKLGQSLTVAAAGNSRTDLDQIQGYAQVLDQRAFQRARERAREISQSGCQGVALTQVGSFVGRIPGDQVGHQVGLRDRRVEGTLQRD